MTTSPSTQTTTDERAVEVSNTIRQQIGVGTFMRIGARSFRAITDQDGGLSFLFTHTTKGGAPRTMYAEVVLTAADDYTVELHTTGKVGSTRYAKDLKAKHEGIYCDQLARLLQVEAGEFRSEGAPSWEK